jgi:hypothetical protein
MIRLLLYVCPPVFGLWNLRLLEIFYKPMRGRLRKSVKFMKMRGTQTPPLPPSLEAAFLAIEQPAPQYADAPETRAGALRTAHNAR